MSMKLARYAQSTIRSGRLPRSLGRASSRRRGNRVLQRASGSVEQRRTTLMGLAGIAPFVRTYRQARNETTAEGPSVHVERPVKEGRGTQGRRRGNGSRHGVMADLKYHRSTPGSPILSAAFTASRLRLKPGSRSTPPISDTFEGETAAPQVQFQPSWAERRSDRRQNAAAAAISFTSKRPVSDPQQSPPLRWNAGAASVWMERQYAPSAVSVSPIEAIAVSKERDIDPYGFGSRWPIGPGGVDAPAAVAPAEPMGAASSERPTIGAIHLDGNALGQWITRHLERTLSQPNRGPSGVDPRVIPTWGPMSAAY